MFINEYGRALAYTKRLTKAVYPIV